MSLYRTGYDAGDPTPPPRWYRRRVPNWVSALVIGLAVVTGGVNAATPALRVNGLKFGANDSDVYATAYGAIGDDATDNTTALQNALNAATAANARLVIPSGIYRSGLITDTTAGRIEIVGTAGTIIKTTAATWLKIIPSAGKTGGVRLSGLKIQVLSGNTVMTPLVWLEGAGTGGIISVNISDVYFKGGGSQASPLYFDCLWLRGVFNGNISNVYGDSLWGSRGVVVEANAINSGNLHFDSVTLADAAVGFQLDGSGGTAGAGTSSNLINDNLLSNFKNVRGIATGGLTSASPYATITLTAVGNLGDGTITVSGADATTVNTALAAGNPQWVVLGDVNGFDQANRITQANTGTGVLTLAQGLRYALANSTILGVGSFGFVIGGNARNTQINDAHCEEDGACIYGSGAQQITATNTFVGQNVKRGAVAINGMQNLQFLFPQYSSTSDPALTLMEIYAQGSNSKNTLYVPTDINFSSPAGGFLVDDNSAGNALNNRYWPNQATVEFDNLTTTQKAGLTLQNTTASTGGVTVQSPPCVTLSGSAWNSGGSASQATVAYLCSLPTSGATVGQQFGIYLSQNGGAAALAMSIDQNGAMTLARASGASTLLWQNGGSTAMQIDGTPEIFPQTDTQGFVGTTSKRWGEGNFVKLRSYGGFAPNARTAASTVTVAVTDRWIGVTGTGARTVNLPAASTCVKIGQEIIIQEAGNDVGTITINRAGSDTINGVTTATISAAYGSKTLVCDATSAWYAR